MTTYKEYYDRMVSQNKDLFDEFKQIHDRYGLEKDKLEREFNEIGAKVQKVIREWEDRLCGRSEGSGYASFTGSLAQKFQDEVRLSFPFIDSVGIIVEEPAFNLKKINL